MPFTTDYEDAPISDRILSVRHPVARKTHECTQCNAPIRKGRRYRKLALLDSENNDKFYTLTLHLYDSYCDWT